MSLVKTNLWVLRRSKMTSEHSTQVCSKGHFTAHRCVAQAFYCTHTCTHRVPGIESTAKMTSESSTQMSTTSRGVAICLGFRV